MGRFWRIFRHIAQCNRKNGLFYRPCLIQNHKGPSPGGGCGGNARGGGWWAVGRQVTRGGGGGGGSCPAGPMGVGGTPLHGRHGPRLWGYPKTGRLFLRTLYSPLNTLSACYRRRVPINSASLPPPPEKSDYFLGSNTGEETAVPVRGFLPPYTLSPLNPL